MKRNKVVLLLTLAVLGMGSTNCMAAEEFSSLYIPEAFQEMEYLTVEDAYQQLEGSAESEDGQSVEAEGTENGSNQQENEEDTENETEDSEENFQNGLAELMKCQGLFIQNGSTGKVYTAEISFYLKYGVPFCKIEYDGYSGTIEDVQIDWIKGMEAVASKKREATESEVVGLEVAGSEAAKSEVAGSETVEKETVTADIANAEDAGYLAVGHAVGHFFSAEHEFTISFGEDSLHIQWGDDCDYVLQRASGAAEELEDKTPPFEESDTYKTICDKIDTSFKKSPHKITYDPESKTMYVFLVISEGGRKTAITHADELRDGWQDVVDNLKKVSEVVKDAVNVATRDGLSDLSRGHCRFMVVDSLKEDDQYFAQDTWAIITDGKVEYDLLDDVTGGINPETIINSVPGSDENEGDMGVGTADSGNSSGSIESDGGYSSHENSSPDKTATSGERNALDKAVSYLNIMAFSHDGLVEQLEYEGYTHSEAVYGADHCGADWKEQAAKKAKKYLEIMSFSRSGLIEQLEYEGFTTEEATYGVNKVY